jgi:hypothetical protein
MGTIHIQKIQHAPPKRKKLAPWVHVGSTEFQKDRDHEKSGIFFSNGNKYWEKNI